MAAPIPNCTAVIIIGGSVVGLSAALFLSALKVPVIMIERHETSSLHPRAMGFTNRTLELFRGVGLESRIPSVQRASGKPRRVQVDSLSGKWHEEIPWTTPANTEDVPISAKPDAIQPQPRSPANLYGENDYSPCSGAAIAQDKLEPLMRARAIELGADLRLGWKMISWSQNAAGVSVTIMDRSGTQLTLTGQHLVACDGNRSTIRADLGIKTHGVGHLRSIRSILFRFPPIETYLESGISQFNIENDTMEGFLTTYRDG